jgi:hypothetical protein
MDSTPPGEETPKDYATRRIDLEESESASKIAASEAEKNARTSQTAAQPVETVEPATAVSELTVPVDDVPVPPPPPPASTPGLPAFTPRNERIWYAAIIGVCVVVLACLCSCTIIAVVFLSHAPW